MKRIASHAGSWYTDSRQRLNQELQKYLNAVPQQTKQGEAYPISGARAIIAPHAGYRYSGPTAAFAYKCVDVSNINRVFVLGPSHHVYLDGCALSRCDTYETPLGDLQLDRELINSLYETGHFEWMSKTVDEDEHSIEMQLPFTAKIFAEKLDAIKVVPIMVGAIDDKKERFYGQLLAKYLADPHTLFIISSDFCHWGLRFSYTYYRPDEKAKLTRLTPSNASSMISTPIHQSITELDHEAMKIIGSLDYDAFQRYLNTTKNTICGRHPIGVLMCALNALKEEGHDDNQRIVFVKYDQSSPCRTIHDSSVSYASAFASIE